MNTISRHILTLNAMFIGIAMPQLGYAQDKPDDLDTSRWALISEDKPQNTGTDLSFAPIKNAVQEDQNNGDPHHGSKTWFSPDPQSQLQKDTELHSILKGGIFVPTMTFGPSEPKYQIKDSKNHVIKEAYTGTTTYVSAGDYTVLVGSPVAQKPFEFDVHVVEGAITTVPAEWSGLIVKVVNDRSTAFRGNYEIVRLPDRAYIGLGSGALINEGERLSTWLLWPGQYMIISAGEGYQARKNFITVDLAPGELSRVTLVLDEDTGDILGGGEIDDLVESIEERWWRANILVGGSVRFNDTENVVGKVSGQLLDVSGFLESSFNMFLKHNFFYTRLYAEIGGSIRFEENRPFVTTVDDLNLELLYTYRFVDWFGPYARFSFESNMAPTWQELKGEYTVNKYNLDGTVTTKTAQTSINLSPSFSPIELNAGVGGRFDYTFGSWLKLATRLGFAYRYVNTRDLYIVATFDDSEKEITLFPVNDLSQYGFEGAINFDLTPIRWFTLKVDASLLEPFNDWENPIVDLKLDAALRLSSIANLSYTFKLNYDVGMIDKVQIDQYIQLRFSYKLY